MTGLVDVGCSWLGGRGWSGGLRGCMVMRAACLNSNAQQCWRTRGAGGEGVSTHGGGRGLFLSLWHFLPCNSVVVLYMTACMAMQQNDDSRPPPRLPPWQQSHQPRLRNCTHSSRPITARACTYITQRKQRAEGHSKRGGGGGGMAKSGSMPERDTPGGVGGDYQVVGRPST